MIKKIKIGIVIFLLLSIPIGLVLLNQKQIFKPRASDLVASPTAANLDILRGNIISFDRNTLILKVGEELKNLSIKDTVDFQLTGSSTPLTLNSLNAGFEVEVTKKPGSNEVLKVLILKRGYEQFKNKKIP